MEQHLRTIDCIKQLYQEAGIGEPFSAHFDCRRFENQVFDNSRVLPVYRSMFNQVSLVLEGRLQIQVNNTIYKVGAGDVLVAGSGNVQTWQVLEPLKGYTLLFTNGFLALNVQRSDLFLNFPYLLNGDAFVAAAGKENCNSLITLYEQILAEQNQPTADKYELIRSYLLILLMKTKRIFKNQPDNNGIESNSGRQIVNRFNTLISEHLQDLTTGNATQLKQVSEFAQALNLHPNYLNEIIKKVLGQSAGQLLRKRVAHEALLQLRQTNLSISEVAYKLGFETTAYFSSFFKRETGYTPTAYRKALRLS